MRLERRLLVVAETHHSAQRRLISPRTKSGLENLANFFVRQYLRVGTKREVLREPHPIT